MYKAHGKTMHDDLDDIAVFPLGDGDVLVSGFPKSGTNWMQVMVANLWDHWTTVAASESRQVPNISGARRENYSGYDACIAVDSPRLMKTHLPRQLMPTRWPEHGKVIHLVRNPKDVCVSLYFELKKMANKVPDSPDVERGTISDFVKRFAAGEVPYGPYVDNIVSWRTFEHPNLLKVTYEETKTNVRLVLDRIVDFVGIPVDDDRLEKVIAETDFDAMRNNDLRFQINHPDPTDERGTHFMRKGIVGDWRNEMSAEDSALLDAEVVAPLEAQGVFLRYE